MTDEGEVGFAAVRAAAKLCQAVRAEMVSGQGPGKLDKHDGSPVTIADFGAQAIVCNFVGGAFPADPIVAEENSAALREASNSGQLSALTRFVSAELREADQDAVCAWIDRGGAEPCERFWALDPIDGTKGFLRNDQYAVALALIERGEVEWGFLGCPALPYEGGSGVIFVARRGAGAQAHTLDGTKLGPVRVSEVKEAAGARLVESVESHSTNHALAARLKQQLKMLAEPIRMDSQAKYGAIAWGQVDIYLRAPGERKPGYRENIWDHAAGFLVVEEAGGRVTDVHGRRLDWTRGRKLTNNVGVLATNRHLHDVVLEALGQIL